MKKALLFALALLVTPFAPQTAQAAPEKYVLDASHSQILFYYKHLGFSTTYSMFSGFDGTLMLDRESPAASSVAVTFPTESLISGWDARTKHLMGEEFFNAARNPIITFNSTKVELTGDTTARMTGDLTLNGVTKPVTLDVTLNKADTHPMQGKPWVGFDAKGEIKRSDFGLGKFAPFVGDDVALVISIEAMKAE
ncbi:MAG: YceI family protein [Rhodospirillales bacterium]